jgi:hypothetical protein
MPTAKRIVTGEAEEVNSLYMKKVELLLNAIKTAEGSPNMTKLLEAIPHYMEQLNTEKKLRRFETQLSIQPLHEMLECGL